LSQPYTHPVLIIPAYKPTAALSQLVAELLQINPLQDMIIINDGSTGEPLRLLNELAKLPQVVVLHHAVNLGKGQALKTAFNYYLLNSDPSAVGIVTADADAQHSAKDIQNIVAHLQSTPQTVCLGSRQFKQNVPFRSRFGNSLTRKLFKLLIGKSVYDTQTGLRGLPRFVLPDLLQISAQRYEYELDMLIRLIRQKIEITEIPIETIYIDDNKGSHFNPLIDSLKVYFVFLRYTAGSLASAVLDLLTFYILYLITGQLFASLAVARLTSGTFNFVLCKKMIFKSGENTGYAASKYILLALFSLALSYILVIGLVKNYGINLYVSKIIADVCIFVINFAIQKVVVFPRSSLQE
jgi:glycosyltransferase involved in cell wall biosynthesis